MACVGDNCVDVYLDPVNDRMAGGNALNVAALSTEEGVRAAYFGAVGKDDEGKFLIDTAKSAGVGMLGVEVVDGPTGITEVEIAPDGERTFLNEDYGVAAGYRVASTSIHLLGRHSWVHMARQADAPVVAKELQMIGTGTSYDFGESWSGDFVAAVLPHLSVAFFSRGDRSIEETDAIASMAIGHGAGLAVVTLGPDGAEVRGPNLRLKAPSVASEIVDTLGAGDAMIAGFLGGLIRGHETEQALSAGLACAAKVCARHGAWGNFERSEVVR